MELEGTYEIEYFGTTVTNWGEYGNLEACAIKQSQVYLNGLLIIWMFEETRPWG